MKLCLVGSTKFKSRFIDANERLTAAGHVVYSVAFHGHADNRPLKPDVKEVLDLVHLRKILESDAVVLITDSNGYIGDSTRREIRWASILDKRIFDWTGMIPRTELLQELAPIGQDDLTLKPMPEEFGHGG